jgi:hypothetical protein
MRVVAARPPLFAEIDAAFHIEGKGVTFAFGDVIYNPHGANVTPELMAHEKVHGARQGGDVEGWWRRYIADPQFRFDEELPAHIAEYRAFCANNTAGQARNARRMALHHIAARLASPLYGRLVSYDEARRLIKAAALSPPIHARDRATGISRSGRA